VKARVTQCVYKLLWSTTHKVKVITVGCRTDVKCQ